MLESEKPTAPAPATEAPQRSRTVGVFAILAGLASAGIGLVNVLSGAVDVVDLLLFVGGLLVAIVGLTRLRRTRAR